MIPTDAKNTDEKKGRGKKAGGSESSDTTIISNSVENQDRLQQKQQWDKPVILKRGATGRVKWFDFEKGFGFITVDSGDESVFVHASSIVSILPSIKCYLADGEKVEFDIMQGVKGKEAVAVTGVGGMKAGLRRIKSKSPRRRGRRSGTQRTHIEGTLAGDVATKPNLHGKSGGKMAMEEGRITGKQDDRDDYNDKTASKRQGVLVQRDRRQGGK